jgi:hemolysin III
MEKRIHTKDMESNLKRCSIGEEIANGITHGIGVILAIYALVILASFAGIYGDTWHVISVSVYGTTLILLYTASTLYHSIQTPRAKNVFQIIDHLAIYILIAGTYTPFTLVSLRGPWGWSLFAVIWCLAFVGTAIRLGQMARERTVSIVLYVGMGWIVLVAMKPLISSVATGGIILLLLGGLSYTFGILFYRWKSLKFHHAVWHLFVLAGSSLHFFAVLFYVIPIKS